MSNYPQRKANHLPDFDYSSVNYYFVTACAKNRKFYFGKIENGGMKENKIGQIIRSCWEDLPDIFSEVSLDTFIVMPNHIHGIIIFLNPPRYKQSNAPATLSKIIGALKSKSAVLAKKHLFPGRKTLELWQKTFYDRLIRNDAELEKTREYILFNVAKWESDEYFQK